MSNQDYYEILGVDRNASDLEIKRAYRRLAMKYHPDRNLNDKLAEEKFKEIQKVYAVLSNKEKRAMYDRFGQSGIDPSVESTVKSGNFSGFGDVFDLFETMFTGGRNSNKTSNDNRGSDLQFNVQITLEEASSGKKINVNIPRFTSCKICFGLGSKRGSHPKKCDACHGTGEIRMQQGFFSIQQTCRKCNGDGKMIVDPCYTCSGQGRIRENKKLTVKIPSGVNDGDQIRLTGEGEAGLKGGGSGDLYIKIEIKPHSIFRREENNLYCEVPINYAIAALGGSIEVPTLGGRVTLKIPGGTQTGKIFRLRGKGISSIRNRTIGDLLCKIIVETPVNLSREQKNLLLNLQESLENNGGANSPRVSSWFDGVKKFFEKMKF
ncbi:molecular chaperone DnaJ [Candidatus Legionella polyplacis]|uniref:Chaperone protein DnaJ n=1 Tax=Candidatus Legionella polyplacis TaxID=2005262 RepID=A0ABZ2H1C6_9GAMM